VNPASTSFVLGYHGCDKRLAEKVLAGKAPLAASHNDYDWLGDGIYFWEHNAQRAYEFAIEVAKHPRHDRQKIAQPAVIGAVIDLGFSLNLLDSRCIAMVRQAYDELVRSSKEGRITVPKNTGGADLLSRQLDCAVLRTLHQMREDIHEEPFDTIRAAFIEGQRLYPSAGFSKKTHIQICVRTVRCIKGYFRPLDDEGRPLVFGR
jgi:hypothetical protein